ncbi:hypothetical protein K466DRAFT_186235 [Polyporus arcularius HHB13444]|uniref:Uncharacterized protein n=1 Tax=Polyporus arcularius HHB13444 TaxID=1314778 RepID=A0A5C3P9B0_9APHY|nr:hypothetical protein K466DRAFT_186235 [Polyporus arcularius HHB13444]
MMQSSAYSRSIARCPGPRSWSPEGCPITFACDGLALVNLITLTCILLSPVEPHCARLCFQFTAAFAADSACGLVANRHVWPSGARASADGLSSCTGAARGARVRSRIFFYVASMSKELR